MAYDNKNRGTLGKNRRKTEDTHPPYAGQCNIDGIDYWISAWVNKSKDSDEKFFGLTFKRKTPRSDAPKTEEDIPL